MTTRIEPFLPVSDTDFHGNEREYLLEAFDSGQISGSGKFVDRFEGEFSRYVGVDHAISCANGTVAIHLALLALGVGPGDEVIVPALTYIATANAVSYCGATPVFADCDLDTWNVSAATISPLVSERTKGIIVVHLYGNPVDCDPVLQLASEHGLFLLEDAAEAHGAHYKGKKIGSLASLATFSFYGNKMLTTGEGGMVTTNDRQLAARIRQLRGQGMDPDRRYWFPIIGYNYRLTNIQCAIGLAQLERLGDFLAARMNLVSLYREAFSKIPGIAFQHEHPGCSSVWWMFSILFTNETIRDKVINRLDEEGIETRPLFYPMQILPPYQASGAKCPNSVRVGMSGINLPTGTHVSKSDVARIARIIGEEVRSINKSDQ